MGLDIDDRSSERVEKSSCSFCEKEKPLYQMIAANQGSVICLACTERFYFDFVVPKQVMHGVRHAPLEFHEEREIIFAKWDAKTDMLYVVSKRKVYRLYEGVMQEVAFMEDMPFGLKSDEMRIKP